jgi:hypothetical protein
MKITANPARNASASFFGTGRRGCFQPGACSLTGQAAHAAEIVTRMFQERTFVYPIKIHNTYMQKLRIICIKVLGISFCGHAQTNSVVFSLVDTPPINGQGDALFSGFNGIGELNSAPYIGLFRSELLIPLPAMPANSQLLSAVLSLDFAGSSGTNGNSTFGPLSVY